MKTNGVNPAVRMVVLALAVATSVTAAALFVPDPIASARIALVLLVLGLVAVAALLVPRRYPVSRADEQAALADLPAEHVTRSKTMYRKGWQHFIGASVVSAAVLVIAGLTPLGPALFRTLGDVFGGSRAVQVAIAVVLIAVVSQAVRMPFNVAQHRLYQGHGIVAQTWKAWTKQKIAKTVLGAVLNGLLLACLYVAAALSPERWWLWMFAVVTVIALGVVFVASRAHGKPLEDGELRDRLLALADGAGVKVQDVYLRAGSKTTKALGAGVVGLGPTKRIVLYERLVSEATHDEIAFVVAHEVVHAKREDLLVRNLLLIMQIGLVLCGLYLVGSWEWLLRLPGAESLTDPAAVGLLLVMLSVGMVIFKPFSTWVSRRVEANADWHALTATGDPDACETYWRRVVDVNRLDPNPGLLAQMFHGSHPATTYRIAMARTFASDPARASSETTPAGVRS